MSEQPRPPVHADPAQEPPGGWHAPVPNTRPADNPYAVKSGLGRAWGLTILSFGLWGFAWFHRNRKLFDGELGEGKDDALLHTLGLAVPVLNFFVIHWLWRDVNTMRERIGLPRFPDVPYLVGAIFLAPVFYSLVLGEVNEYWDARTQGLATDAPMSGGEKAAIGVGIAIWLLFILMILLIILLAALFATESSS